jgi:hypothetical protein
MTEFFTSRGSQPNIVELALQRCTQQPCPFKQFKTIMSGAILKDFTTASPLGWW